MKVIIDMKTYLIVFQINYQILAELRYRVLLFEYKKWFLSLVLRNKLTPLQMVILVPYSKLLR